MAKTVTLRLPDDVYEKIIVCARADNRPLSNFIETMTMRKIEEDVFVDVIEMGEIRGNATLMKKLKKAHKQAKAKKGAFVAL